MNPPKSVCAYREGRGLPWQLITKQKARRLEDAGFEVVRVTPAYLAQLNAAHADRRKVEVPLALYA